jgi:hypothetical protein
MNKTVSKAIKLVNELKQLDGVRLVCVSELLGYTPEELKSSVDDLSTFINQLEKYVISEK